MTLYVIFLFTSVFCTAQHVNFEPSLKIAFDKARQQNKLVFIEYYNAECPVCKKLEPVFSDNELAKFYNENFISYKLNTENIKKEDSLFIEHAGLKFESVPWFLFFDKEGNFVHYSGTKQEIAYLIAAGQTAMDPQNRSADLHNKYNSGDRSIKTLYAYSNLLQLYKNDSLRVIIADDLFSVFPKEDLGTEKSYIITKNCVGTIENGFFVYWIKHVDEIKAFEKNAKTAHETNVLGDILLKSINSPERQHWGLDKIKSVKEMVLRTEISKDPDAFFWEQESRLLVKENRANEAMNVFRKTIVTDSDNLTAAIYDIGYFLEIIEGAAELKLIKTWIDKLSKKNMSRAEQGDMMYCNILYFKKIEDKKTAKKLGQEATGFYKANHIDAAKLNQLLDSL